MPKNILNCHKKKRFYFFMQNVISYVHLSFDLEVIYDPEMLIGFTKFTLAANLCRDQYDILVSKLAQF